MSLTHAGVAAALLAAKKKSTNTDVAIIVDHTMLHCSGSKVKDLVAGDVTVSVDLFPSFMQHHKYVLLDDHIVIHGSVSLTQHAMVSAGVLAIHEDLRMVQPLAHHFANVGEHTINRQVQAEELLKTKPCRHCADHEKRAGHAAGPECKAVDPDEDFCRGYFLAFARQFD
ncbi:hypothetical protein Gpo141_00012892 [Globisporangium polare]